VNSRSSVVRLLAKTESDFGILSVFSCDSSRGSKILRLLSSETLEAGISLRVNEGFSGVAVFVVDNVYLKEAASQLLLLMLIDRVIPLAAILQDEISDPDVLSDTSFRTQAGNNSFV
jgi:hypothetical protein